MVTNCWVPHCRSRWYKYCEIKFHTFPVDKKMRRLWASRIITDRMPSDSAKVCSLHFCKNDYEPNSISDRVRLKKTAVPSRNLDSRTAVQFKPEMRRPPVAPASTPLVEQQTEQSQTKPVSFKMKIRKNPAAVNANGGWKTDSEFTVPVDPYYLYDESYDDSTPVASSASFTNPYSEDNSLLQESGMQSDDNSLPDQSLTYAELQSYAKKNEHGDRHTDNTPQPNQTSTRNLRKRRRSIPTADSQTHSTPTHVYQRTIPRPLPSTSPPKPQIPIIRNTALTKPCESELVDGFCKYLAMQLKRLSAQMFLDVQMDVQKIVLQAQRVGLENGHYEWNDHAVGNARVTNGYDEQQSLQNHSMDERVISRKGGDDELEWEECQIKSEPMDDDENEGVNVEDDSTGTVVDLEHAPPLPVITTMITPRIVTIPFPTHSQDSTLLPKITMIDSNHPDQPTATLLSDQRTTPTISNGTIEMENNADHVDDTTQDTDSNNQPQTAFSTPTNADPESDPPTSTDRLNIKIDSKDDIAYKEIACAVSTLSGAVGSLSTILNGLHPYKSDTKT